MWIPFSRPATAVHLRMLPASLHLFSGGSYDSAALLPTFFRRSTSRWSSFSVSGRRRRRHREAHRHGQRAGDDDPVNDIEHIESQSYNGSASSGFLPAGGARVEAAVAQITALTRRSFACCRLPPRLRSSCGTAPPACPSCSSASPAKPCPSRPLRLGLKFHTHTTGHGAGRLGAASIGASRGRSWWTSIRRHFRRAVPADVSGAQCPEPDPACRHGEDWRTGIQHPFEQQPGMLYALNDIPVKQVNGTTVYIRDVAQVRDGYARADQRCRDGIGRRRRCCPS